MLENFLIENYLFLSEQIMKIDYNSQANVSESVFYRITAAASLQRDRIDVSAQLIRGCCCCFILAEVIGSAMPPSINEISACRAAIGIPRHAAATQVAYALCTHTCWRRCANQHSSHFCCSECADDDVRVLISMPPCLKWDEEMSISSPATMDSGRRMSICHRQRDHVAVHYNCICK